MIGAFQANRPSHGGFQGHSKLCQLRHLAILQGGAGPEESWDVYLSGAFGSRHCHSFFIGDVAPRDLQGCFMHPMVIRRNCTADYTFTQAQLALIATSLG